MLASLPMYDFPEVRDYTDALWAAMRDAMRAEGLHSAPEELAHPTGDYDAHWASPRLFFSQICGLEVVKRYRDRFRVVATPHFSAAGCLDHCYRSLIVIREDAPYQRLEELRDRVLAFNSYHSHSGRTSLLALIAPLRQGGSFFARTLMSGSHEASLELVLRGEADVASVDCVSLALLERYRPRAVQGIRVIAETPAAPGPPYVAPADLGRDDFARMRAALRRVFGDPRLEEIREALFLGGLEMTDESSYRPILDVLESEESYGGRAAGAVRVAK